MSGTLGLIVGAFVIVLGLATILLPFYVAGIHNQLRLLNKKTMRLIELKEHEMRLRVK